MWGLTSAVSVIAMSGDPEAHWYDRFFSFRPSYCLCEIETCSTLNPSVWDSHNGTPHPGQPQRRWVGELPEAGGGDRRRPAIQSRVRSQNQGESQMAQKVIDVVGTSKESFAKAAENAVAEAAKTVRGMQWARVAELEMELDGKKIVKYRTTTKIYFDIEK
jgi:flavin-binding protein dodecin